MKHLLPDGMHKIPVWESAAIGIWICHRDESYIIPDASLDPERMSQCQTGPVRLNGPVVLAGSLSFGTTTAAGHLSTIILHRTHHSRVTTLLAVSSGGAGRDMS